MSQRCHLILNPRSGSGRSGEKIELIFSLLKQDGIAFECTFAETFDSIKVASEKAHSTDCDTIVAVGGDGTINAVINGFYEEGGALRSDKKMAVIYTGTSPDFCKSYGIPLDIGEAVKTIGSGRVRRIKTGRIVLNATAEGRPEIRYFSCCASIGIGAMVAGKANRYRKQLGDTAGTMTAILSSLASYRPGQIILSLSNEKKEFGKVTNIFIGRTKYIASGLKVSREIQDEDDDFYILCVHDLSLARLPGLLRQLYTGRTVSSAVMQVIYDHRIGIESGDAMEVEFDGDPAGYTPCRIQSAPEALPLIVRRMV